MSSALKRFAALWFDRIVLDLARQFRWSFLPPLMVYLAAGVAGLTGIVGTFFIKDYLNLSAAFIASLGFWVGIPWALKMPIGHLVDLIWRYKAWLVYLGASLIAVSLGIMYGLVTARAVMETVMPAEAWFIVSTLLSPAGYVIQDVVADAMTVEAVPATDLEGNPHSRTDIKAMHTTMQTLGRVAIISGLVAVSLVNITVFSGIEKMTAADKLNAYAGLYLAALVIPVISVAGVILAALLQRRRRHALISEGVAPERADELLNPAREKTTPNWWILGGALIFACFTLGVGLSSFRFSQEVIFAGSLAIVLFLMRRLLVELKPQARLALAGTAVIIFIFRAVPLPGPGVSWWQIDVLSFDQQFLSVLALITSALTLAGMLALRHLMATYSIAAIVAMLTVAAGALSLPNIGLYYGLHHWTASWSGGVIDARFIAILDTALESPLGQLAMIPMLAWIARSAPNHLKATFFAVMASFTNLALLASNLGTKYLNKVFIVTREVRDPASGEVTTPADYSEVGVLLITVTLILVALPLITIAIVQRSRFRTLE